jgi:hypothetical protein
MGRQIIRQPDGRLAEFSTIVDAFVIYDATPEELAEIHAEEAASRAREETLEAAQRAMETGSSSRTQFAMTWDEAYALHLAHGGEHITTRQRDAGATQ